MNLESLLQRIADLERECLSAISAAQDDVQLQAVDLKFLSKKGLLSELLKSLRDLSNEDRPKVGAQVNQTKQVIEKSFQEKNEIFKTRALNEKLEKERVDVSLPTRRVPLGSLHPVSKIIDECCSIFKKLGFEVAEGPEVETEFHNFDALNMPEDHPARDMQDTFYLPKEEGSPKRSLLRTHTSPVQIRTMIGKKTPPVRIICPGAVFRSDYDMTHSPMFHQVEGLFVDKKVSFAELKGTLLYFAQEMFGADTKVRLRPSFFPFVEPGAEIDVTCVMCKGKGCRVCKDTGWLEILGGGMLHPKLFEAVGFDKDQVQGFAFGMGVERIAMLKYGIPDLRLLFENDVRFLRQFGV